MNILVVDDEMLVRTGLRTLLSSDVSGFSFAGDARNGAEALELIPLMMPVIVITDIVMPGMTGLELMETVRERGLLAEFIVLTSHRDFEYARRAVEMGAIDYLLKHEIERDTILPVLQRARVRLEEQALKRRGTPLPAASRTTKTRERRHILLRVNAVGDARARRGDESLSSQIVSLVHQIVGREVSITLEGVRDGGVWHFTVQGLRGDPHRLGERIVRHLAHSMNLVVRVGISLPEPAGSARFFDFQFCEPGSVIIQRAKVAGDSIPGDLSIVRSVRRKMERALEQRDYETVRAGLQQFAQELQKQQVPRVNAIGETTQLMACFLALGAGNDTGLMRAREAAGLDELLTPLRTALDELAQHQETGGPTVPAEIARVRDLVQREYPRHLSLEEAARVAGKSVTYFSDFFRHHQGTGFVEYVNRTRVNAAAQLLLHSNDTIAGIAAAVGFPNEKYFSRMFKRIVGVPPGAFRSGNRTPSDGDRTR